MEYDKQQSQQKWRKTEISITNTIKAPVIVQGGSNMIGTDLCANKLHLSRSYLNHLVFTLFRRFRKIAKSDY